MWPQGVVQTQQAQALQERMLLALRSDFVSWPNLLKDRPSLQVRVRRHQDWVRLRWPQQDWQSQRLPVLLV